MCTRSSAYIQAHSLALRWMPGTAAGSGLRVKSCIALPSTDFMPIQPTQVYQKGDQISAVSSSLWTLSLSIPLGKSALLFCVSSYHNADSVSPLICNMFCFLCKKKKKKEMFCFFTLWKFLCCLLLAFSFSLYCTVTPFCKMVLTADWAPVFWLLCTPITRFFILQRVQCENMAPMNSTNSCLLEADRKCLINILWPGFGCISQIVSCNVLSTPPRGAFSFLLF